MKNKEKDLLLKETKEYEKNRQKLFTKKKTNNTIRKNYNPLKVNYKKVYKRGSRLCMENETLKEIKEILKWKDKIFIHIFPKAFIKVYKKGIEKGFNSRI